MKQHTLQTALTLYQSGTQDLETAARQAGISQDRLLRAAERLGHTISSSATDPERVSMQAD